MNRKNIIIIIGIVLAVILTASIVSYLLSFHSVTFKTEKNDMQVVVYKADDTDKKNKIVDNAKSDTSYRLQEGNYQAIATSEQYTDTPIMFSVGKADSTINIDAAYSDSYLDGLVSKELATINVAINTQFSKIIGGFALARGKLYDEGQWYTTTLTQIPADQRDEGDIYHIILLKENGTWKVIGKPTLVLTQSEFKDVPLKILQDANRFGAL